MPFFPVTECDGHILGARKIIYQNLVDSGSKSFFTSKCVHRSEAIQIYGPVQYINDRMMVKTRK
jgi:hypothetical protein